MISSRNIVLAVALTSLLGVLATSATATDPAASPATSFEFVPTGPLAHGRIGHPATLLPDGRIAAAGVCVGLL